MIKIRGYKRRGITTGLEAYISIRRPSGERITEKVRVPIPGKSESAARTWAEHRAAHLIQNGKVEPIAPKEVPRLSEFHERFITDYCEANRQKPSGVDSKRGHLRVHLLPALGKKRLNEIDDEAIARLKSSLKDCGPKTVNNILSTLSKLLKVAEEWGIIDKLPCRIRMLKYESPEMEFYGSSDYARLVEAAQKIDQRILAMILLGGDAGLRRGEMVALERSDVDYRRGVIRVLRSDWRGQINLPKGGRKREVPMTERLGATLKALKHLRGPRVLYWEDDLPARKEVLYEWMASAQRRAGLEVKPGLHILRHTFCSRLAMKGAPAMAIKELAGHAKLTTTMRYMHLSPGATQSAIRLLDQPLVEEESGGDLAAGRFGQTNSSHFN